MGVGCSLHAFEGGVCNIKELGKRQPGLRRGSSRRVERSEEGGSELFLKVSGLGGPKSSPVALPGHLPEYQP